MMDFHNDDDFDEFAKYLIIFHYNSLKNDLRDKQKIIGMLKYNPDYPDETYYFASGLRSKCEYIDFDYTTTIDKFNFEKNYIQIKSDIYYLIDQANNKCTIMYFNGNEIFFDQAKTKTTKD